MASMAVKVKMSTGERETVAAQRLHLELGDTITDHHATYYIAQKDLTADQLLECFPMVFPCNRHVPYFPRIAACPVGQWERCWTRILQ